MNKKSMHEKIATEQPNICQMVVYKAGVEVYSDTWNGYAKEDACHVMSVTKSIVSLLIGIALDQGLIESLDQKVLSFFPEYEIKGGEKTIQEVNLRHLLTMTAPYKSKGEPWSRVCSSEDWTEAALDLLGGKAGLTGKFRYVTLGIHILTGILAKVSGLRSVDYANQYLFKPLGVTPHGEYHAETAESHKAFTRSKKPKDHLWLVDPQGVGAAGFGLCFSAADMAKIGQLCLNKGVFKGQRVVSESWIKAMSTPKLVSGGSYRNMTYGYLWWIIDHEKGIYAALGNSGNAIYIDPAEDVVIAVSSYFKPSVYDRVDFIKEELLPLVR